MANVITETWLAYAFGGPAPLERVRGALARVGAHYGPQLEAPPPLRESAGELTGLALWRKRRRRVSLARVGRGREGSIHHECAVHGRAYVGHCLAEELLKVLEERAAEHARAADPVQDHSLDGAQTGARIAETA